MMEETEKLDWLQLARTQGIGPVTFFKLIAAFGSAKKALENLPEIARRGGRSAPFIAANRGACEKEYNRVIKSGGHIIPFNDDAYPALLKQIDDPPPVLSVLGNPEFMQQSTIAIVGARNASINGKKFVENLARDLGQRGHIIASGLARGVDTAAHHGSLDSGTIAVIAGGLDIVYPEENQGLYDQIREKGCIIAESPLGQKPFAQSFPRRNRIVSGLSRAVIVGEANMRSGSLITARLAGEHGRELMAIPGSPADPRSAGPNHLIREGAVLVRSADDVLESLLDFSGGQRSENPQNALFDGGFTPFEFDEAANENDQAIILENLSHTPIEVDELIRNCSMNIGTVQTVLLELELADRIKRSAGNRISLCE